ERIAARDLLEHDPAPSVGVALPEQMERGLDACLVLVRRPGELGHGQRHGGDDEQSFERAGSLLERRRIDETKSGWRVIHATSLSTPARRTPIGENARSWSSSSSF